MMNLKKIITMILSLAALNVELPLLRRKRYDSIC